METVVLDGCPVDGPAEQAETPLTSPPVFLSSSVTAKLDPIETEVRKLIKKPKPKPPKKPKSNSTDTNSTASAPPANGTKEEGVKEEGVKEEGADGDDLTPHDEL